MKRIIALVALALCAAVPLSQGQPDAKRPETVKQSPVNDPLRLLVAKSDVVATGEFVRVVAVSREAGVHHYRVEFKLDDIVKGKVKTGDVIELAFVRIENAKDDALPLLKEKAKALVFVAKPARETRYTPTDEWLWLHHAHPLLVKRLLASAAEPPGSSGVSLGGFSKDRDGNIESRRRIGDADVLHGFQAKVGRGAVIKEYSYFDRGHEEVLVQLYPNGDTFRSQHRDKNGDGDDTIYSRERTKVLAKNLKVDGGVLDVIVQDEVCSGRVKAGRCWDGSFLVREQIPFGFELKLNTYKDGKRVSSVPFPLEKIGLPADTKVGDWRWTFPAWPESAAAK